MVTNVTVSPVTEVAVVYFQDGSTMTVEPQTTKNFQLVDNGFCTISETVDVDEGEHPDQAPPVQPGVPPHVDNTLPDVPHPEQLPAFAEKMLKFWKKLGDAWRAVKPTATPYKKK
jgi:hypothetical protein